MATDHCKHLMIKNENWYSESVMYGNMYSNNDPFCQNNLNLNTDTDGKYSTVDACWSCPTVQPTDPYMLPSDYEHMKTSKFLNISAYEDCINSPATSNTYSSSPSSINSQNFPDYQVFSFGHENTAKKTFYSSSSNADHPHRENYPEFSCLRYTCDGVTSVKEELTDISYQNTIGLGHRPPVKRRNTANRKERRRTQSINNAFSDLRDCIPNVPADTKLSKIKTLRLATSYISYLMGVLSSEDPNAACSDGFKADLSSHNRKNSNTTAYAVRFIPSKSDKVSQSTSSFNEEDNNKKTKGRTGWPQHVWALELKQ